MTQSMPQIVCATRGGQGSRVVQEEAIRRSQTLGRLLVFLYISDPTSQMPIDASLWPALQAELNWMGQTLLHLARQRAEAAGLLAQVVIRQGDVRTEISRYVRENGVELLLLGASRHTSANVFGDDAVEQFAAAIQGETGVPVEVIRPEAQMNDLGPER